MNYSIFWARLLGLYAVILSIGMFFHLKQYQTLMADLAQNPLILMTLGMITLFLGLGIVLSHRTCRGWPILITILGYWITFKGIVLLFFPQWVSKIVTMWQSYNSYVVLAPTLILGLILLICGFIVKRHF
ncbi:hypothetical protein [Candidatus Berkiella aquae]|uniref:Uncharacterized protein n=1 Tax=Candidatus Berkiella aquae TaxID=295108 RepID=A0A0Q9YYC2_9GAMM|nr:hypothetical protein [Candidatus Berkiella aquae]MCS5711869.1 hypothetical protein [Candidatus Berkiella aquae]